MTLPLGKRHGEMPITHQYTKMLSYEICRLSGEKWNQTFGLEHWCLQCATDELMTAPWWHSGLWCQQMVRVVQELTLVGLFSLPCQKTLGKLLRFQQTHHFSAAELYGHAHQSPPYLTTRGTVQRGVNEDCWTLRCYVYGQKEGMSI